LGLCQDGSIWTALRQGGPRLRRGGARSDAAWQARARACVDGILYTRALRAKGVPGGGGCGGHNSIWWLKGA
jgi:hypothetical protein